MRKVCGVIICGLLGTTPVVAAEPRASFLGATTYTRAADCPKTRQVAAVGPIAGSVAGALVSERLTADGYASAEKTCSFTNISERYKDRLWTVTVSCQTNGGEAALRSEVWRKQSDGSLTVTTDKTSTTLVACPTARRP